MTMFLARNAARILEVPEARLRASRTMHGSGSIPYCEVADIQATFSKALAAGATEMFRPEQLPGGMGRIAIVAAPGGVAIGFWAKR